MIKKELKNIFTENSKHKFTRKHSVKEQILEIRKGSKIANLNLDL